MFYQTYTARRPPKGPRRPFVSLVTSIFDLDLQTRPTKHVFRVNLAQIRSAVPEIFHTQTKKTQTDSVKTEPLSSSLCAVYTVHRRCTY